MQIKLSESPTGWETATRSFTLPRHGTGTADRDASRHEPNLTRSPSRIEVPTSNLETYADRVH
jgi:hypothetical protein